MITNDITKRHPEIDDKQVGQGICIETDTLPRHFDKWRCFLHIRKPSQEELKSFPVYALTSPHEYEPQSIISTRRLTKDHIEVGVED